MESIKTKNNIADFPSKLPVKLSKRVHTNIHLVSSTPMNPSKRAKFFDESNQLGSPIRSGSSTDVISNSPNKNKNYKIPENKLITNPKMSNNEEQTEGASPFPYYTKLSVKKMTICASEDDSDDNIFVKSSDKNTKTNKILLDDIQDDSFSNTDEEYNSLIIEKQSKTEAIVEPIKKVSSDNNNKINVKTNKNVTKTKPAKPNVENKENENIEKKPKTKQKNEKSTHTNKVDPNKAESPKRKKPNELQKTKTNKIELETIDVASENENNKISTKTMKLVLTNNDTNLKSTKKNITEIGVRKSGRNCTPAVPYWMSPWTTNTTISQNDTHILKRTKSDDVNYSTVSVKEPKRPKTVPETSKRINRESKLENTFAEPAKRTNKKETVEEKNEPAKRTNKKETVEEKIEPAKKHNKKEAVEEKNKPRSPPRKRTVVENANSTKTLNKSKAEINEIRKLSLNDESDSVTQTESEPTYQTKKKENKNELSHTTKTLTKDKAIINEIDKNETVTKTKNQYNIKENDSLPDTTKSSNKIKTKINEADKKEKNIPNNEAVTRSKNTLKKKENDKNTTLIEEVVDTTKTLNKPKTKIAEVDKKRNVLKLKDNENNIETVLNEQNNKTRSHMKEILDTENKEKKKKIDNIFLRSASFTKYNTKEALSQSVLKDEVFASETEDSLFESETEDNVETASRKGTSIKSKNTSKRENVDKLFTQTFEVASPPRTSKRLKDKTKESYKETTKIVYTPAVGLNRNLNDSSKKSTTMTENKTKNKTNNRTLTSKQPRKKLNESENSFQSDVSNSETSKGSGPSRLRKRTVEKPKLIKIRGNKTLIKTPRYIRKSAHKNTRQSVKSRNKQVNFNFNNSEMENSFESDTLSPVEQPSKKYRNSSRNLFNQPRTKYSRKNLFYKPDSTDGLYKSNLGRYKYRNNDSTLEDSDSLSSEEFYIPQHKKRKYMFKSEHKRNKENRSVLHFKERALAAQVPAVTRTVTEIQHHGKSMMMECFGNFPNIMTKASENSALRGTCFMNDFFASGVMEIKLGKVKSCKGSKNHTYFIVLDGVAEFGIANSTKIMRIGDCCIVPKHTFYYISNVSSEINLLINFLKISL